MTITGEQMAGIVSSTRQRVTGPPYMIRRWGATQLFTASAFLPCSSPCFVGTNFLSGFTTVSLDGGSTALAAGIAGVVSVDVVSNTTINLVLSSSFVGLPTPRDLRVTTTGTGGSGSETSAALPYKPYIRAAPTPEITHINTVPVATQRAVLVRGFSDAVTLAFTGTGFAAGVELSLDGGSTWEVWTPASATATALTFTIPGNFTPSVTPFDMRVRVGGAAGLVSAAITPASSKPLIIGSPSITSVLGITTAGATGPAVLVVPSTGMRMLTIAGTNLVQPEATTGGGTTISLNADCYGYPVTANSGGIGAVTYSEFTGISIEIQSSFVGSTANRPLVVCSQSSGFPLSSYAAYITAAPVTATNQPIIIGEQACCVVACSVRDDAERCISAGVLLHW